LLALLAGLRLRLDRIASLPVRSTSLKLALLAATAMGRTGQSDVAASLALPLAAPASAAL
jgi:hypothetical protein